jgi:hypothetical protein
VGGKFPEQGLKKEIHKGGLGSRQKGPVKCLAGWVQQEKRNKENRKGKETEERREKNKERERERLHSSGPCLHCHENLKSCTKARGHHIMKVYKTIKCLHEYKQYRTMS